MANSILWVQENLADAEGVRNALADSQDQIFCVKWVQHCHEAMEQLSPVGIRAPAAERGVDAILLDLFLSDSQGIATFDRLFAAAGHIPILILTTPDNEASAKLAVARGAYDYVFKNRLDAHLLARELRNMMDRTASTEALFQEKERAQVTLNSIGDAVISTDLDGHVTFLNIIAERLTGWSREAAMGRPLEEVLQIVDAVTRETVRNPMRLAISADKIVGLTPDCILVHRDGIEVAIEDSAAPIHDRHGLVTGAVMVLHDVSSARAQSLKMSYLAQHDSLTDLPNRVLLSDRLDQAMSMAQRGSQRLGILYLDIDRFKTINDSLGHAIGDRLLQAAALRLLDCVRHSDTVSRQGGDEFVILLSRLTLAQDAAVIAEKILAAFGLPFQIDEHTVYTTLSIGVVTFPDDGLDAESLLKNADFAMYQAKESGRSCYQFFKPEMNARATRRQSVENGLRAGLERDAFVLHYQPKFDLQTGAITAVEALIRWRHPMLGMVPPAEFISIAEDSGLIVPLGRWVLREGCSQAKAWQDAGLTKVKMAINVSAVELRAKNFVDNVSATLRGTGLDAADLELELTETFLMQDPSSTVSVLHTLKGMGVSLALDDFGTGYSSLSYLRRFPIDTLKIDRSFLFNVTTDDDNASIVEAVITMGRSLRMRVVAEGVETPDQLTFLRAHDCPEGQGFLLGRPVAAKQMARLLERDSARGTRALGLKQGRTLNG